MPGLLRDTAQLRVSGGFSARHCQRARLQLPECSRQSTGGSCHLCRTQRGSARGATGTQTQTVHSRSRGAPPVTPAELGEGGATAGQETSGRAGLRPWPGLEPAWLPHPQKARLWLALPCGAGVGGSWGSNPDLALLLPRQRCRWFYVLLHVLHCSNVVIRKVVHVKKKTWMFQNAPGRDALSCSPAPAVPPPTGEASRRCPSLGRQRGPGARPAASAGSALRPPRGSSRRGAQTHQGEGEEPGTAAQTQKSLLCGHRLPVSGRQDRDGSRKKNLSGQFRTPASSPLVKSSGSQAGAALPLTGHSETSVDIPGCQDQGLLLASSGQRRPGMLLTVAQASPLDRGSAAPDCGGRLL